MEGAWGLFQVGCQENLSEWLTLNQSLTNGEKSHLKTGGGASQVERKPGQRPRGRNNLDMLKKLENFCMTREASNREAMGREESRDKQEPEQAGLCRAWKESALYSCYRKLPETFEMGNVLEFYFEFLIWDSLQTLYHICDNISSDKKNS